MATFDKMKFYTASVGYGDTASCDIYVYKDETNLIADLKVSGFFDDRGPALRKDALIYIVGSDDRQLCYVDTVGPIVVVDLVAASSITIPDSSITAAKLANSACENEKIAANAIDETKLTAATAAKLLGTNNVVQGNMATNSIGTTQVLDNAITPAKLSYIPAMEIGYYHATPTGAADDSYIITGTVATDFVVANLSGATGGNPTGSIRAAYAITNGVTVEYNGSGSTGDALKVLVLRTNEF